VLFSIAEMEPPLIGLSAEARKPDVQKSAAVATEARERFGTTATILEAVLRDRKYLVGDAFGVADVMVGATLAWARSMRLVDALPSLEGYLTRLRDRPAWQRAMAD
jgi:glutathione S-transferase